MRQSLRRIKFDFNFAPVAIFDLVVWTITDNVLVAQFNPNFSGYISQFIRIGNGEHASAGDLRNISQQGWAGNLFLLRWGPAENTDGVNLYIGFFDHGFDLIFRITAVIVAAIRDNEQGFLAVPRVLHLAHAHINGVEHGRASLRHRIHQLALYIFDRLCEISAELRTIIK